MSLPEKLAPNSVEAEEAALGSILINADCLPDLASFLQASDFFIVRNAWVWDAILAVAARNEGVDNLTVIEELRTRGQLEKVGGSAYITGLINNTPTHIHAETYAHLVQRAAIRRRLLAAASDIAQTALEEDAPIEDVLDHCEATLYGVTERHTTGDLVPAHVAASRFFDRVERLHNEKGSVLGVPTGLKDLDWILGGLAPATLNIVAARPGQGKSDLLLTIARNLAARHDRVALFSLEMSEFQLMQRFASNEADIDSEKLKVGNLDADEWGRFADATARIADWKLVLDESPKISVAGIRAKCRKLQRSSGLDIVLVDYLQLAKPAQRAEKREQEVSAISQGLKELAREFDVPFLVAAQLNRAVETRVDKRPQLSDLRESGSIEQEADVVLFIYREDQYKETSDRPNQADIIVAKNRDGKTGCPTLYYRPAVHRFTNMERSSINLDWEKWDYQHGEPND